MPMQHMDIQFIIAARTIICGFSFLVDVSIIRHGSAKRYGKARQTSTVVLRQTLSIFPYICPLSHQYIDGQHEAEAQQQCRRAASVALCGGDHILTDDIEHRPACEGQHERQRRSGETDGTIA